MAPPIDAPPLPPPPPASVCVRAGSARRGCGTRERHAVWCNTAPQGVLTSLFYWGSFTATWYAVSTAAVAPLFGAGWLGWLLQALLALPCSLALLCHLRAMLTNPGAVPAGARPLHGRAAGQHCAKCAGAFKPPRARHCSVCGRCIIKLDHHCPWINNCVGLTNMKFFWLYTLYNFVAAALAALLIAVHAVACYNPVQRASCGAPAPATLALAAAMCAAVMVFSGNVACGQRVVAMTNRTTLDHMFGVATGARVGDDAVADTAAGDVGAVHPAARLARFNSNLAEVCGGDPRAHNFVQSWRWLLPTRIDFVEPEDVGSFTLQPRVRSTVAELEML